MGLTAANIYQLRGRRILGINPPVVDFAWFDLWAKPLGLLNLLGFLRDQGNQVTLLDCLHEARTSPLSHGRRKVRRTELPKPEALRGIPRRYYRFGLGPDELRERLERLPRPDLILLTSIMTYWYPGVFECIGVLKEVFPDVPLALGGIYAALCPEHAAASGADLVLTGHAPKRPPAIPLDLYEPSADGLTGLPSAMAGGAGYAVLATSYGCPGRCAYCASSKLNPGFQPRPAAEVKADADRQLASGLIRDLAFYDDALLLDRNLFRQICDHLGHNHPGLRLHSPNGLSVAALDEPCCELLFQSGFSTLRLSLEGIDPRTRSLSDDKAGRRDHQRAVANLLKAGFNPENIETYLLLGLPGQRSSDVEAAIDYVKSVGSRPKLCEFSPIPGTSLFEREAREHPIIAAEPLWHNNSVYTPYLSRRVPPEELQRLKGLSRE